MNIRIYPNYLYSKNVRIELEFFIQAYLVRVTELVIYVNDLTLRLNIRIFLPN